MFFIFFMFPYNSSYNYMFNHKISYNYNITKKNTPSFTTRSIYNTNSNTNLNKIVNITCGSIIIVMFTYITLRIINLKSNTMKNTMQIYNFYLIYASILIIINVIIFNIKKMILMIILYIIIMYIKIMIVKLC